MASRKYTPEFKREAVRLVREEGMTYAQVGTDLGVDKTTIRDWCVKRHMNGTTRAPRSRDHPQS
jgi:transposase